MITIAIVAQKGGVGKTTTAHAIGAGLTLYRSAKVLYVDVDAQGNLSRNLEADNTGAALNALDALTGRAAPSETIQHTKQGDIIASTPALSGAEREPTLSQVGREYRLKKALDALSGLYDYAIIDTPPALSIVTVNALTACHRAVIPAQADVYSLDALRRLREAVETVKLYCNPSLQVDGILITRYNSRTVISREIAATMETEAAALSARLYQTRIRECTAIKEAQTVQTDIFTYAPRSNAARDYKALLDEMEI